MHFGDSIFIFLLALVLFGPKKLPEIGRTVGKLLAEFRRASNEFKFQIQEELRNMEEDERRKKLAEAETPKAPDPADPTAIPPPTPTILPPSTGTPVSTSAPYATPAATETAPIVPSDAEIAAEPAISSEPPASAADFALEPPARGDLNPEANGAHPPVSGAEAIESSLPSESVHHG
jgi:sec-independent protein translocase protein TatB